jgi:hypothetical protein
MSHFKSNVVVEPPHNIQVSVPASVEVSRRAALHSMHAISHYEQHRGRCSATAAKHQALTFADWYRNWSELVSTATSHRAKSRWPLSHASMKAVSPRCGGAADGVCHGTRAVDRDGGSKQARTSHRCDSTSLPISVTSHRARSA